MQIRTHDRVQLTEQELSLDLDSARELPWAQAGVATLRSTRLGVELEIGPYAGQLVMGETVISVAELVPGTVAACLEISSSGRRMGEQMSPTGVVVSPDIELGRRFAEALDDFLTIGFRKQYQEVRLSTSRPHGRILVGATVKGPWARGNRRAVAVATRPLTEDTPVNRYLLAAGLRAQHLLATDPATLIRLRESLLVLSGSRLEANPPLPQLVRDVDPASVRALYLARTIFEGVPAVPSESEPADRPVSAWVNVERVFEEAMLSICSRAQPGRVKHGATMEVLLFTNRSGEEPAIQKFAEPDIVIRANNKTLVLDAKYRRSGESPADSELYQLISHAGAFGATSAALIAPALHSPPATRRLGRVRDGCSIDVLSVDPRDTLGTEARLASWISARLKGP